MATPQAEIKDAVARVVTSLHRAVFQASNGRLFNRVAGMPVLLLETTGRRSGKTRSTMLTCPLREDDRLVLVASYGGDPRHPSWFLNLEAHPQVAVVMDGTRRPMTARIATGEERARLWPEVTRRYRGYAQYQRWTDREIPLVILEP